MSRLREATMMSDPRYTPKGYYKPGHCVNINTSATDKQYTGDAAPLGYCPFSKHPLWQCMCPVQCKPSALRHLGSPGNEIKSLHGSYAQMV